MDRTRLVWLVALVFCAGALLSAYAFSRAPIHLVVTIANLGSATLHGDIELVTSGGAELARWEFTLRPGGDTSFFRDLETDGRYFARAELSGGQLSAIGLNPSRCDPGDTLRATFQVETTGETAFTQSRAACE